jgi:hypothetical protein
MGDPAPPAQYEPAGHCPLHELAVWPVVVPVKPAAHGPEQAEVERSVLLPYVPAGQGSGAEEPGGQ